MGMANAIDSWLQDSDVFQFQGYSIFTRQAGNGQALLLIHGFPTSSLDWALVWPELSERYCVHALDMLGFGQSDKPRDYSYTLRASADQWQAYALSKKLADVFILAHDYGDTVAQELLARQREGLLPFRIHRVCMLNGGIFPEATRPILVQKLLLSKVGPLVAKLSSYPRFAKSMRSICSAELTDEHLQSHWQSLIRAGGRSVMPKIIQYIRERHQFRARWLGALQQAAIPLCLINGVQDPISGANIVRRWRELLPGHRAVELNAIGHYPQWESPARVLVEVQEFFKESK
jgi:pimeloyl-ACP methyl ester carboxylesterase